MKFSVLKREWTYENRSVGHEWLYGFTMATFNNVVYVFGGKEFFATHRQDVYKMNDKFGYDVIPEKMRSIDRHEFSAIQQGNRIVHFGGDKMQFAECWTLNDDDREVVTNF